MFDRLERPFLTVETGEAYQPVRLTYETGDPDKLVEAFDKMQCLQKASAKNTWNWYWQAECDADHFASVDSYRRNADFPVRLGTIVMRNHKVYLNLPSFKRACLAVPFFYRMIDDGEMFKAISADFINKVFALDERLPHGFTELFKDEELDHIIHQRMHEYDAVRQQCELAKTPEDAFKILADYTRSEAKKRLPFAERYAFELSGQENRDVVSLAFYIFLRGRELVAIKRWLGQTGYSLADVADETVEKVFGDLGLDFVE